MACDEPRARAGRPWARHAIALGVFVVAAALVYGEVWRAGAGSHVPVRDQPDRRYAHRIDAVFEIWLVSRHARTLVRAPHRLFDTEHCAPARNTLSLGIPMIALGALGIVPFALTGDPVLTYNVVLALLSLLGAWAMYLLVVSWTGVPAAGIVAGLLFGFHPVRLFDITHPSVWDTTWLVFGLFFAERLSGHGRWRDAAGLALAIAFQIAASFYTTMAAALVGLPFAIWLAARDGIRRVRPSQIAAVLAATAVATLLLLGPYLSVETGYGGGLHRGTFIYAAPADVAPGGPLFPGWSTLGLALIALAVPRRRLALRIRGEPRPALLVGGALAGVFALGDHLEPLPALHGLAASVLPGVDAVRVVMRVATGAHLVLALLAGLGAAVLVRRARFESEDVERVGPGRAALATSAVLVLLCAFDVARAPALGFERSYAWRLEPVAPDADDRAFFRELAALGNDGPLLELPVTWKLFGAERILSVLDHGRRTSACFASFPPAGLRDLEALARRLPAPEAVDALMDLGFTTIVIRDEHDRGGTRRLHARIARAAEQGWGLEHLLTAHRRSAYALRGGRS